MIPDEYVESIYVHLGLVETVFVVFCSCKKTLCSLTVQYDWLVSNTNPYMYTDMVLLSDRSKFGKKCTHLQHVTVLPL